MALGQSQDCPSAGGVTLTNMSKNNHHETTRKDNKSMEEPFAGLHSTATPPTPWAAADNPASTLRHEQHGHYFTNDIFKCNFSSTQNSLKPISMICASFLQPQATDLNEPSMSLGGHYLGCHICKHFIQVTTTRWKIGCRGPKYRDRYQQRQ